MNMRDREIKSVELGLAEAHEKVAIGEAALRLADNPDFKKLILEGYCRDNVVRLTNCLNEVGFEDSQDAIKRGLEGVAEFTRYMRQLVREGELAEAAILDHEETLDALRAEQ